MASLSLSPRSPPSTQPEGIALLLEALKRDGVSELLCGSLRRQSHIFRVRRLGGQYVIPGDRLNPFFFPHMSRVIVMMKQKVSIPGDRLNPLFFSHMSCVIVMMKPSVSAGECERKVY